MYRNFMKWSFRFAAVSEVHALNRSHSHTTIPVFHVITLASDLPTRSLLTNRQFVSLSRKFPQLVKNRWFVTIVPSDLTYNTWYCSVDWIYKIGIYKLIYYYLYSLLLIILSLVCSPWRWHCEAETRSSDYHCTN